MDDVELSRKETETSGRSDHTQPASTKQGQATDSTHGMISESHNRSFSDRILSIIPPLPLLRPIIKGCLAILISIIFLFNSKIRNEFGQGIILVPISTILSFPFRPIGVGIEIAIQSLFISLVGSAWSILAMYLANLARDPTNLFPVQPHSSAVLSIFMLIGVFVLTYVRILNQQAFLASIFGSIIIAFSLTQASVVNGFQPSIVYAFLKPVAGGTAIGLAVDLFIWPDDSMTKYMGLLGRSLKEYNAFFEEHSRAFLNSGSVPTPTLPTLHARLQGSVLALIDSKREVQREILWSRLSQKDVSELTRLVKQLRSPLYGIGLSLLTQIDRPEVFSDMNKIGQELVDLCIDILNDCNGRLAALGGSRPRSFKSTLLWPFPRLFFSTKPAPINPNGSRYPELEEVIKRYETAARCLSEIKDDKMKFTEQFGQAFQMTHHFQFSLVEHTKNLSKLVALVERLELSRTKARIWFPHQGLHKWFNRNQRVDANMGGMTVNNAGEQANDLGLSRTMTVPDALEPESLAKKGKIYRRDPDVNPPETRSERFFYQLHQIARWAQSVETVFALKTATGFTLLSLPAFLAQSATWFFAWRGQWATVTLMMWMSPMAGVFLFGTIMRVIGTIVGGVLGIVVWEITRGNPYGLSVLTFFVMMPFYYLFFTKKMLSPGVIMVQITTILVICYEYQYTVSGATTYDSAEVVAGKRMLLVIIGVAAAAIMSMIPKPVTGRVELRKRISVTLQDLSKMYGILARDIVAKYDNNTEPTPQLKKAFRKLFLDIRRQIADERSHLMLSRFEPPLRGKFPVQTYTVLVEKIDNMADLLLGMAYATRSIDRSWQSNLVSAIRDGRVEYVASILSLMKLLSATLSSKVTLPPFIVSPNESRAQFIKKLTTEISSCPQQLDNDTFPNYCSFTVNAGKFSEELNQVLECVKQLVGVEDPEQWLLLNA
ncbi:hypothetical protein G6F56_002956 [Rhizopus delemar]|uniref:ER transporter 6TM N-terminal domain-containing protein n=1 Tax=Rhizopus stolonifer TaxID=4846 RepID=A0A367KWS8_RHIST|nr:hypothetical protein G6F56_002956 [Rhizopus delemar]RCI06668.1 hypothetical protein CU098_012873 [Rhizopus stolonifer]